MIVRRLVLAAMVSTALAGCVTLLPETKDVQLYRFGYDAGLLDEAFTSRAAPVYTPVVVTLGVLDFPQDSRGDRLLTSENNEISYIADARWTTQAQDLFQRALSEGFSRSAMGARLEPRGPGAAVYRIDVLVRRFESVYVRGKPTVSVALDLRVVRLSDRALVSQTLITSDVAVGRNDVSMTVDAYDKAVSQAVAGIILECERVASQASAGSTAG